MSIYALVFIIMVVVCVITTIAYGAYAMTMRMLEGDRPIMRGGVCVIECGTCYGVHAGTATHVCGVQ